MGLFCIESHFKANRGTTKGTLENYLVAWLMADGFPQLGHCDDVMIMMVSAELQTD